MLQRLLTSALLAGFAGGLIIALLQIVLLSPIIIEAEEYEAGNRIHFEGVFDRPITEHDHGDETIVEETHEMEMDAGFFTGRSLRTVISTILTSLGYSFVMVAGFAIAERGGVAVTARSGMIWGMAGFIAFNLATSAGLPPELPGSYAAPLQDRQLWWIGTAVASVAGLASIAFGKNWVPWAVGIALLALPHIIGAPVTDVFGGVVPPELQGDFVGLSLGVSAVGWVLLGLLAGFGWARQTD